MRTRTSTNIVFHRGRPGLIDFDEFGKGWYLFDVAELVRASVSPDNWTSRKSLVVDAYAETRPLDEVEVAAFDGFLVATFVQYLNWAHLHARGVDDLKWQAFCINVIRTIMGNGWRRLA